MDQRFIDQFPVGSEVRNFAAQIVLWKGRGVINVNSDWGALKSFLKRNLAFQYNFETGDFGSAVLKDYVGRLQSLSQKEHSSLSFPQTISKVGTLAFDFEFKNVLLSFENNITLPFRGLGDNEGHLNNAARAFGSKNIMKELRAKICPNCYVIDGEVAIFLAFGVSDTLATPRGIG